MPCWAMYILSCDILYRQFVGHSSNYSLLLWRVVFSEADLVTRLVVRCPSCQTKRCWFKFSWNQLVESLSKGGSINKGPDSLMISLGISLWNVFFSDTLRPCIPPRRPVKWGGVNQSGRPRTGKGGREGSGIRKTSTNGKKYLGSKHKIFYVTKNI